MRALVSRWPVIVPLLAVGLLAAALKLPFGALLGIACGIALVGAVVAAVHHAEIVAHRVGEPFGTLVLALAVTAIESSLIVSVMLAGGASKAALARDTMYATVMIIVNGVVGACVLLGALRHREQTYRIEGAGPALAALATLVTLVLVMPGFTVSAQGPRYTPAQLTFVAVSSLVMWCVWVFFQTVRHRDYFLPPGAPPPTNPRTPRRPPPGRRGRASPSCWWRWSRWSGSRRCFRRRSRRRCATRGRRPRSSAWRSPSWCSCPRPSRPSAPRSPTASRRA